MSLVFANPWDSPGNCYLITQVSFKASGISWGKKCFSHTNDFLHTPNKFSLSFSVYLSHTCRGSWEKGHTFVYIILVEIPLDTLAWAKPVFWWLNFLFHCNSIALCEFLSIALSYYVSFSTASSCYLSVKCPSLNANSCTYSRMFVMERLVLPFTAQNQPFSPTGEPWMPCRWTLEHKDSLRTWHTSPTSWCLASIWQSGILL